MAKYVHASYAAFVKEGETRRFVGDCCLKINSGRIEDVRSS